MTGADPTRVQGRRIIGFIIDNVVDLVVIGTVIGITDLDAKFTAVGTIQPEAGPDEGSALALLALLFFTWWAVSRVFLLGMTGWTPGMLFMGIRCVTWKGKPCGIFRAFLRSTIMLFGGALLGNIWNAAFTIIMWYSKGHRAPHDYAAGTLVIDAMFNGRMIIESSKGFAVGPPMVTREDAKKLAEKEGVEFIPPPDPRAKAGEPVFDKELDTYVVYNAKQKAWLAFDKGSGNWNRIG